MGKVKRGRICYGDRDDWKLMEVSEMADVRKGLGSGAWDDVVRGGPEAEASGNGTPGGRSPLNWHLLLTLASEKAETLGCRRGWSV